MIAERLATALRAVRRRRPAGPAARLGRLRGRAGRRAGRGAALAERRTPHALASRRARRRAGLRHRRARRARGRRLGPRRGAVACVLGRPRPGTERWAALARGRRAGGPHGLARRRAGPPPGSSRLAGPAAGPAAQPAAGPAGDQPPLRPVQRVLRAAARPVDGLLVRLLDLDRPVVHARGRPARQARPGLPQARPRARACPCSTSAAAGDRCPCTPPSTSARGSPGSRSPRSRRRSSTRGSASAGWRTWSRSGCRTTARSGRGPVRRGRLDRDGRARRRGQLPDVRRRPAPRRPARRTGAGPADEPHRPASRRRAVHRVLHRPRHAHAARWARPSRTSSRGASRCATCTACASTTCAPSRAGSTGSRRNLDELTALVGEEVVRVWRLYLVGGQLAFRDGRMGVDQILCVRPGGAHSVPPVRAW